MIKQFISPSNTFVFITLRLLYLYSNHKIISNASCTTNCLAPIAKIVNDNFKIKNGLVNTIHSYTNDQKLLDTAHVDLFRARSATESLIPTKTGAASVVGEVIPELQGKMDGLAIRVPTPNVSLLDFTFNTSNFSRKGPAGIK